MVAGARVKKEGLDNNLCELILNDPMFMITKEEMDKIMKPETLSADAHSRWTSLSKIA